MTAERTDDSELGQQRAAVETAFREGWVPLGTGEPRALIERSYAEARKVLDHGGWTGAAPRSIPQAAGFSPRGQAARIRQLPSR